MPAQTWIIGCGDIGRRVAALYDDQKVHAIVRSQNSVDSCQNSNINASQIDLDSPYTLPREQFNDANVYYFAPPAATGQNDLRLEAFLNAVSNLPKRILLISTTGVYGDSKGEWIDENTPINPQADRAHRRASAEQLLQRWASNHDKEFMILRVPGIYAQDRLPLSRLKKGLAIVNENEAGWTNRIHADDLAQVCKAAMECEPKNQIINATDGHPSSMTDYFNQVADYVGLDRPAQISMAEAEEVLSDGIISYLKESRRIKNDKILKVLNITLKYPTLEKGLGKK